MKANDLPFKLSTQYISLPEIYYFLSLVPLKYNRKIAIIFCKKNHTPKSMENFYTFRGKPCL